VDRCVLYVYRLAVYYAENDTREPDNLIKSQDVKQYENAVLPGIAIDDGKLAITEYITG
jgi:hypothetical protein